MYTSCGQSPYVATFDESSTEFSRVTALEKKGSWHNPQHVGWPIRWSYLVSLEPILKQWGQRQASVDGRLLGLLGPYHQHTIGTFNTCSRGPTHQYLNDTGGGYNLARVGLPTPLPDLSNRRFYTFHLMVPQCLRLSIQTLSTEIRREQTLNLVSETSPLDFYRSLSSKHSMS
jgi:hypothetical protein